MDQNPPQVKPGQTYCILCKITFSVGNTEEHTKRFHKDMKMVGVAKCRFCDYQMFIPNVIFKDDFIKAMNDHVKSEHEDYSK